MSGVELATILTAVFGAFGSILYGFYRYAQAREKDFEKARQLAAKAYAKSTKDLSKALDRVAKASERTADEAKQRNGHLAELSIKSQELILAHNKDVEKLSGRIIEAVSNVIEQHVGHQTVDKADIKEENVEKETIRKKS